MRDAGQIHRQRAKRVIAIDRDQRAGDDRGDLFHERIQAGHHESGIEEHVGKPHHVRPFAPHGLDEALVEARAGFGGNAGDDQLARFFDAAGLAPEAVKLVRRRDYPVRAGARQAGEQAQHEFVGIGRKRDLSRIGPADFRGDVVLRARHLIVEHLAPFAVGQGHAVLGILRVRRRRDVRPRMVTVRGAVEVIAKGGEKGPETVFKHDGRTQVFHQEGRLRPAGG